MDEQVTSLIISLSEHSRSVPARLDSLSKKLGELGDLGEAVKNVVSEQQGRLSERSTTLNRALDNFNQQAKGKQEVLVGKLEEFAGVFAQWQEGIDRTQAELTRRLQETQSLIRDFRAKLVEGHKRCQRAEEQMMQVRQQAESEMEAERDRFLIVMDGFRNEHDELCKALEQVKGEIETEVGNFVSGINSAQTDNRVVFQETLSGFAQHREMFQQNLESVSQQIVIPTKDQVIQDLNNRVDREIKEMVEGAAETLKEALKDLAQSLTGYSAEAGSDRSAIESIRKEVVYLADHVDDLAREVASKYMKVATFGIIDV